MHFSIVSLHSLNILGFHSIVLYNYFVCYSIKNLLVDCDLLIADDGYAVVQQRVESQNYLQYRPKHGCICKSVSSFGC